MDLFKKRIMNYCRPPGCKCPEVYQVNDGVDSIIEISDPEVPGISLRIEKPFVDNTDKITEFMSKLSSNLTEEGLAKLKENLKEKVKDN